MDRKDAKAARKERIFSLWLAGYTQQEIAAAVGVTQAETSKSIPNGELSELNKTDQNVANHETDFDPPIYNVWKQQSKTAGSSHFGNSEVRWVDNLLYLYTSPFDVVVDPFVASEAARLKKKLKAQMAADKRREKRRKLNES